MSQFRNDEIKEIFSEIDTEVKCSSHEKEQFFQKLTLVDEKISNKKF